MFTNQQIFDRLLSNFQSSLNSYESAEVWRTMHRISVENDYKVCVIFKEWFTPKQQKYFESLEQEKIYLTDGKRLLTIKSYEDSSDVQEFQLNNIKVKLDDENHKLVSQTISNIINRLEYDELVKKVKSGELKPVIGKDGIYKMEKDGTLREFINQHVNQLELTFMLLDNWPDNIAIKIIFGNWHASDENFDKFKYYFEKYFIGSTYDFNEILTICNENILYLNYLINWGKTKEPEYLHKDYRGIKFNMGLLKIYREDMSNDVKFFKNIIYNVCSGNLENKDKLTEMYDYLFEMAGLEKTGQAFIKWARSVDYGITYANGREVTKALFIVGYVKWDQFKLMGKVNTFDPDDDYNRIFMISYISLHKKEGESERMVFNDIDNFITNPKFEKFIVDTYETKNDDECVIM